jgi:hypothetical protein
MSRAIKVVTIKIPEPIIEPATMLVASSNPSVRFNSVFFSDIGLTLYPSLPHPPSAPSPKEKGSGNNFGEGCLLKMKTLKKERTVHSVLSFVSK